MDVKNIIRVISKELSDKQLFHFAASLSFHTLLSIIPIIFVSLSIFTTMPSFKEYYTKIKEFIYSNLLPSQNITQYLDQFLNNSSSLGVMGVVAILFTSLLFFIEYEYAISTICNIQKRKFWQGLSNYWTLITLMPLGLGLSFWLSSSIHGLLKSNEYIYLPKGHSNQSSTEIKALALAVLDSTEETKRMKAVINSLNEAASRFDNADEIKQAIIKNVTDRHLYPYRNLGNLYISEKTFYKTKALFIFLVAEKLNYI